MRSAGLQAGDSCLPTSMVGEWPKLRTVEVVLAWRVASRSATSGWAGLGVQRTWVILVLMSYP